MEDETKSLGIFWKALIAFTPACNGIYCMKSQHGSTFVWSWLCLNLCSFYIDLQCISSSYVPSLSPLSHGSTLYSSSHVCLFLSWIFLILFYSHNEVTFTHDSKNWCNAYAYSMILFDQDGSYLEVITFSIKSLTYHIPLASCFGGHSVIPKYCHQHVIRSLTPLFSLNPKLEVKKMLQMLILHLKLQHRSHP